MTHGLNGARSPGGEGVPNKLEDKMGPEEQMQMREEGEEEEPSRKDGLHISEGWQPLHHCSSRFG